MRQMSRPRKPRKGEDKNVLHWVFDAEKLARLIDYCAQDVRATRAIWNHPKLKPLIEDERRIQILDAVINRRGVRADRELATAARDLVLRERIAINAALHELTDGAITSVDQTGRILAYANERGHAMTSVSRRSVSAVLAAEPDEETRQVLELRRDGARASVRKYERILAYASEATIACAARCVCTAPVPVAGAVRGPQLQNLKKNESDIPLAAVEAVRAGDRAQLRQYGNPLDRARRHRPRRGLRRAGQDADGGRLRGDRIENPRLARRRRRGSCETYREFDRTNDKANGAVPRHRGEDAAQERSRRPHEGGTQQGQGRRSRLRLRRLGRRVAPHRARRQRSDPEIFTDIRAWRDAHPQTTAFWRELARAIRIAIRTGQPFAAGKIIAGYEDGNLYLTLPSGRRITYPQARLVAGKYENGDPDVLFKDNARGKWSDYRGWFGTFVENVVQGTARDLLAAAIERFEARGHSDRPARARRGDRRGPGRFDLRSGLPRHPARAAGVGGRPAARRQGLERAALSRAAGGAAAADRRPAQREGHDAGRGSSPTA